MEKENKLYSSGELAKLAGVNKRTLHYYNDIGLLRPEKIDDNGYHYYSIQQFATLQIILVFRQIGVSIEEIKTYFSNYSDESFSKILLKQENIVNNTIDKLLQTKNFLAMKAEKLELGKDVEDGKIELCSIPERKVILSDPFTAKTKNSYLSHASDFLLYLKKKFNIFDSFGSRISADKIIEEKYDDYDCYFAYSTDDKIHPDLVLEEGTYLRAYSVGAWNKIPILYNKITEYAESHNITLSDYFYEEGLNDLSFKTKDEYITMITIKAEKK